MGTANIMVDDKTGGVLFSSVWAQPGVEGRIEW